MEKRSYEDLLEALAGLCGIVPEYYDIFGNRHSASEDTKRAVLSAMGLKVGSFDDIENEYNLRLWKKWKGFVPTTMVISVNEQPLRVPVYVPLGEGVERKLRLSWSLTDEKGRREEQTFAGEAIAAVDSRIIDGVRYVQINLPDNARRDIGYYSLSVRCYHPASVFPGGVDYLEKTVKVIIAPDACFTPPELKEERAWGLSVNLYAVRSSRNWGVGDFTDLREIVRWTADMKGGFVGINPLHAIPNARPFGISPYSPISRIYRNFIYLDLESIPEVTESEQAGKLIKSKPLRKELEELRKEGRVDYDTVASLKEKILRRAFDTFYERHYVANTPRGREFLSYCEEEGDELEAFALFMTIAERRGDAGKCTVLDWREWPGEYRNPSNEAVLEFKRTEKKEILFYEYVQWLIDRQLKEIADEVRADRMAVGLYNDLAVGAVGGGSDTWRHRRVIADDVDLGAPPDDFNLNGQNWGFPPMIPETLKESGYELFIRTIRKNMQHGGALRIDHALGLFRLFWVPRGMQPKEGAYVRCYSEDLLRIIALESIRNRTMVVAEDLGTIGENARETLQRFHMLSYRLFYFERNYPEPSFLPPDRYPRMALCAVTTHDLPTLYGFWSGWDLEVKKRLGLFLDEAQWQEQVSARQRDKGLILSALKSQGVLPDDYPEDAGMTAELCLSVYRYLAMTPCRLVLVSLDDVIGALDQQNMPGTVDKHPNWLQKTPFTLEEIMADRRFKELASMFEKTMGPG